MDINSFDNLSTTPFLNPSPSTTTKFFDGVLDLLHGNASFFTIPPAVYFVSYTLSLMGITMIIYALVRMVEIAKEEDHHLQHAIAEYQAQFTDTKAGKQNAKWNQIQDLVNSPNHSDWRLAIIEADLILEDLLESRGVHGMTIGDKLKSMTPGDLGSIQAAWEAHLVRNRIAHEGSDYEITQVFAARTIQLYEVVFQELGFV